VIVTHEPMPPDAWKARRGTFETRCITVKEFSDPALHLMQFTRSAIFNFTYCARHETRATGQGPNVTLTLEHKKPETRSADLGSVGSGTDYARETPIHPSNWPLPQC
jgi:hypothetical protein